MILEEICICSAEMQNTVLYDTEAVGTLAS